MQRLLGVLAVGLGLLMLVCQKRILLSAQRQVRKGNPKIAAAQRRNNRVLVWVVPIGFIVIGVVRLITGR